MTITIQELTKTHYEDLIPLVTNRCQHLLNLSPQLPCGFCTRENIASQVEKILEHGQGFIAYENQKPIAYIISYWIKSLFYDRPGTYTPEWAHNLTIHNKKTSFDLLEAHYNKMIEGGYIQHAITIAEVDAETTKLYFDHGYSGRCMDGHRVVKEMIDVDFAPYSFDLAIKEDKGALVEMLEDHHTYMNSPKALLGFEFEDETSLIDKWFMEENVNLYSLKDGPNVIGMMKVTLGGSGGCDMASDSLTIGIQTTQIHKSYQGFGLGAKMINFISNYAFENQYKTLTVDWESHNRLANAFWPKHFKPTLRSVVRYIG